MSQGGEGRRLPTALWPGCCLGWEKASRRRSRSAGSGSVVAALLLATWWLGAPVRASWLQGHLAGGIGACAGPLCLAVWGAWPSQVLDGASVGGLGGARACGTAFNSCLDRQGLTGPVGCHLWAPGGLCPMAMGALSRGFLCCRLGGCVFAPVMGCLGSPWELLVAWVLGPLCLLLCVCAWT